MISDNKNIVLHSISELKSNSVGSTDMTKNRRKAIENSITCKELE
jgi:hypothetical protein